jgi:hypothetical protein
VFDALAALANLVEWLFAPFGKKDDPFPLWLRWFLFGIAVLLLAATIAGLLLNY